MNSNNTNALVGQVNNSVHNSNGQVVNIESGRIYPCSEARKLLLLSDDKFKRAVNRNRLNLLRKPYSYSTARPDDVKSWQYGIKGEDLITVGNDARSNPEWELVPSEDDDEQTIN